MEKIVNIYDLTFLNVAEQQQIVINLVTYGVYKDGDKYVFDKNLLEKNIATKTYLGFKPLVEKVEKLIEMVNVDNSLIDKDIETELWDML